MLWGIRRGGGGGEEVEEVVAYCFSSYAMCCTACVLYMQHTGIVYMRYIII